MAFDNSLPAMVGLPPEVPRHTSSDENSSTIQHGRSNRIIQSHVDSATLATASQRELNSPADCEPRNKGESGGTDSPAIEESTEARLERLGRQRPEVFDS